MLLEPKTLGNDLDKVEEIEKASMRLVTQAVHDFRQTAAEIFRNEKDLAADIGEDITREALDSMGVSRIGTRLFGKMDYKRARYVFHPDYAVRQALFVDSKAEKTSGQSTATLQTAQTSMRIRHMREGLPVDEPGKLPPVIDSGGLSFLVTTIFVKYNYRVRNGDNVLVTITVAALPNAMLQSRYNPTAADTIWRTGRNAPTRGEAFRVRLVFNLLRQKMPWRVQIIPTDPKQFAWQD
jgi:hypothetical protein